MFHAVGIILALFASIAGTFLAREENLITLDGPWKACSVSYNIYIFYIF